MRIAWYSNHPDAPTGYGEQSRLIIPRLAEAGHEVHIIQQFGGNQKGMGMSEWQGLPVYPQGAEQYSVDVLDGHVKRIDPDYVMTLFDVWPLVDAQVLRDIPVVSWTPIDTYPVQPKVAAWAKTHATIAMSEYGHKALAEAGAESVYIPHALEAEQWTPRDASAWRESKGIPQDAYLVVMNFANNGVYPDRKGRSENLQAIAAFLDAHPDAHAYIHTDMMNPGGVPLFPWLKVLNMPEGRFHFTSVEEYRAGLTTRDDLADMYSAADVFLAASAGEGFGIPVAEAMMCGTPAIVTAFSAQPEIVGETGWAVPFQFQANWHQGAMMATPSIQAIIAALEEGYQADPEERAIRSGAARARAVERYDMDTVWADKWVPLLDDMEQNRGRLRAQRAGLTAPPSGIVGPDGQTLNRAQRRAQNRKKRRG